MKKLLKDFKEFIQRGNVVDMAIGVIIGGAFGKIVTSLVNDIIMPVIGLILGGNTLSGLSLVINGEPRFLEDGVTANPNCLTWNYGNFIQSIIDFLIIAVCVFLMIKLIMALKDGGKKLKGQKEEEVAAADATPAEEAPATPAAPTEAELLMEIRDLLKAKEEKEGDKE